MKRKEWLERLYSDDFLAEGSSFSLSEYVVDRNWELHGHEFYEMELVLSGSGFQWINGFGMPLARGSLYLLSPVDVHRVNIRPDGDLRLINFKFPEAYIEQEVLSWIITRNEPLAVQLAEGDFLQLERDFRRVQVEQSGESEGKMLAIRFTLNRMLIDLLRFVSGAAEQAGDDPRIGEQQVKKQALSFIHRHFREPITLGQAAAHVNLSPNYFSEKFHHWTGEPFRIYVLKLRLVHADMLIDSSTLPITDIAYNAGFNSLAYFIRAYKQHRGVSPNQARKQTAQGENR